MPTAQTAPITPAVLAWALAEDGRSRSDLARSLKVQRQELDAWATGNQKPTVGQVSELAGALHRARAFFFLPAPPTRGAMPDGFRHPPGSTQAVSAKVLLQARRAKRVQQAVATTMSDGEWPAVPQATRRDVPPAAAAVLVRAWLEVPDGLQFDGEYEALRGWRALLETAGVLVFELQLGEGAVRGFAGWDDRAPMIVMNQSRVTPQMRLFTIGHELGHLMLREATACLEPMGTHLSIDTQTERWCEQFAAALLMPALEVTQLMNDAGVGSGEAGIDQVKAVAGRFWISYRAAALRLVDLGFAREGLYGTVQAMFKPVKKTMGTPHNPPTHRMRVRQYGAGVVMNVLQALPINDALGVLRLTVEDVRKMADEVPGVPSL